MGQAVFHPKRLRHEPTAVVFNTLESYRHEGGTLPVSARFTLTPVGEWMGTTRIELGMARTPKFWLVVVDDVDNTEVQKGTIPLAKGESFWLMWNRNGVWARKPRFHDDVVQLGGISIVPPARDAQQQPRLDRLSRHPSITPPAVPPVPAAQQGHQRDMQRQPPRVPSEMPSRQAPSPGSESETSWPSEDNEDYDSNTFMQTGGRAASSADPAPGSGLAS